jgi:hypothetical protein
MPSLTVFRFPRTHLNKGRAPLRYLGTYILAAFSFCSYSLTLFLPIMDVISSRVTSVGMKPNANQAIDSSISIDSL